MSSHKLTPTSYLVLGLTVRHGPVTSYELKQRVQESLGNFWSFPHSQLYAEPERLALAAGEDMVSEVVNTGAVDILIDYNVYLAGDNIDLDYRHGGTVAACEGAGWNNYVAPFTSLGFVQVKTTSTL